MTERKPDHLRYKLVLERPLIGKVLPRGEAISKALYRPLRPGVELFLKYKPTSAPTKNVPPNDEVLEGYRENWLSFFGVRTPLQVLDRPKTVETVTDDSFSSFHSRELKSGVTKVTTCVEGRKVTAFIAPPQSVPYSFRTMDILPDRDQQVAVSASLRKIAKATRNEPGFPALTMTSAGLNSMVIFSDAVYLESADEKHVEEHVKTHIKETTVSIGSTSEARFFTFTDFFEFLNNPPGRTDYTTKATHLPGADAHWFVTRNDGAIQVMSASDLRTADKEGGFRETIASISPTTAFVNETVADAYADRTDLPHQLLNALVLFTVNGEQRISSVHGTIDANAVTAYTIAKQMIESQFPDAEDIAVGTIDGGGSTGAIVRKDKKRTGKKRRRFDRSTLPFWPIEHEIPIYTGIVPKDFVTSK